MRKTFHIDLPEDILTIKDIFVKNGFKLFVVGGAVRDALLGQEPKDFDLATDATPEQVAEMMKGVFAMKPLGEAFGISFVMTPNDEFEIATFREDIGAGRRPDEVKFTTIEGDVKRRDLTINALFFDIETSEVVDLVGGVSDLENKVIRAVGNAKDRFFEDKLRVLRAIRFATRFNSNLDKDIVDAINEDSTPISGDGNKVSNERIRDEFLKALKTAFDPRDVAFAMNEFGLWDWIFPTLEVELTCELITDPLVHIAVLLSENSPEKVAKVLNEQTFSNEEVKTIKFLLTLQSLSQDTALMLKKSQFKKVDDEMVPVATRRQIIDFANATDVDDELLHVFLDFQLRINGKFVMEEFGIPKGPQIGKKIQELEQTRFDNALADFLDSI